MIIFLFVKDVKVFVDINSVEVVRNALTRHTWWNDVFQLFVLSFKEPRGVFLGGESLFVRVLRSVKKSHFSFSFSRGVIVITSSVDVVRVDSW